ncbi:MAG: RNA polymerase sigma factor [Rhodospirillales bacterium]
MNGSASQAKESLLTEVFREQRGRLWGFLMRGAGEQAAAEDLLQETFLRVFGHRRDLSAELAAGDRESVRKYIWRVARNLMIDEIRYRRRRRLAQPAAFQGEDMVLEAPDPAPGSEEILHRRECRRAMREAVAAIRNGRRRRCLQLWLDGMSLAGIAARVGLGTGQVRGLLQRARAEVVLRAGQRLRAGK